MMSKAAYEEIGNNIRMKKKAIHLNFFI